MSEQRNLLLAIVLSIVVVFGWQYFVGPPKPTPEQLRQQQTTEQQRANPAAQPGAGAAAPGQRLPREEALKQSAQRAPIDTPTLSGSINLTGARFDDLRLKLFRETPDPKSPEIVLLSSLQGQHPYFTEFGWIAEAGAQQSVPDANAQWKIVQGYKLATGQDIELAYDNGQGLTFTRRISVDQNYMFTVVDSVDNHTAQRLYDDLAERTTWVTYDHRV